MILSATCNRIASLIGNLLEQYDCALFGLLAPFIAPIFFPEQDPFTALILTYGILPLSLLSKPLGSLFFGWIGDQFGRKQALFYSLLGTAFVTIAIGMLPGYLAIGIWAPILLALARMLQSFFVAGESTGGALFLLEHTKKTQRSLFSGLYSIFGIGGIVIASSAITFMSLHELTEQGWRLLFLAGGLTAILGIFLRKLGNEGDDYIKEEKTKTPLIKVINQYKTPLLLIILASGFSHVTYSLSFTFMNGFVPLITSLNKTKVMILNTNLLLLDMILLPFFGYLAHKLGKEKIMLTGSLCASLLAIPLFSLLPNASIYTVTFVRVSIIIFGIAFAAPYYAWAIELVPSRHRYLILALGSALGSQLIGAPSSAICLWLYKATHLALAPGLYLMGSGLLASFALRYSLKLQKRKIPS